jgi:hypothetical protein
VPNFANIISYDKVWFLSKTLYFKRSPKWKKTVHESPKFMDRGEHMIKEFREEISGGLWADIVLKKIGAGGIV